MANKTIAARISKPLYDELERLAERQKVVKSRIIENAVYSLLARESASKQAQTPSLRESKHVETPACTRRKRKKNPKKPKPRKSHSVDFPRNPWFFDFSRSGDTSFFTFHHSTTIGQPQY